jgi:imidazolonepropionase-like amidohydrolase
MTAIKKRSVYELIRAATINYAREFKIDSQVATIEQGKIANFVLLKKSPLKSVDAYDSIVTVWIHGKQISRDSLAVNPNK